jgi:hypothetical protein
VVLSALLHPDWPVGSPVLSTGAKSHGIPAGHCYYVPLKN